MKRAQAINARVVYAWRTSLGSWSLMVGIVVSCRRQRKACR